MSPSEAQDEEAPKRWDYVAPGIVYARLDEAFPGIQLGDPGALTWPWLRKAVPHTFRVHSDNPAIGFVSRDEAHLLLAAARTMAGKDALEIGCWRGWSTAHLAHGGVRLQVVDPELAKPAVKDGIADSLRRAGVADRVELVPGRSPRTVEELAAGKAGGWSLIFVDGDHEGEAPRRDAEVAARFAAPDAMVLFHDLASPHVAAGLARLRDLGWKTRVYQTMQIMGVAWRGAVEPPDHIPDPRVEWELPAHLEGFEVSGLDRWREYRELEQSVKGMTMLNMPRLLSLYRAARRICEEDLPGNLVECGSWRGGSAAVLAQVVARHSRRPRKVFACDTFAGMPEAEEVDRKGDTPANLTPWGTGSLAAPREKWIDPLLGSLGRSGDVEVVQGLFSDTLPEWKERMGPIALLHADGDFYRSTRDVLDHLYDPVVEGGFVQIDDYFDWSGCRKAVDEFVAERGLSPWFSPVGGVAVWMVKGQAPPSGVPAPPQRATRPPSPAVVRAARSWATSLPPEVLGPIQRGVLRYRYRGVPMAKSPFEMALYPLLLWDLKPHTVFEIGSYRGGSAFWFADMLANFGIEGCIHSVDVAAVTGVEHPAIRFWTGDQRRLAEVLPVELLETAPHPWLVVEDGSHDSVATAKVLEFFHPRLRAGDYLVVEDGILTDLGEAEVYRGGPGKALKEFLLAHPTDYALDVGLTDWFGHNATWCTNGFVKRVKD